MKMKVCIIGRYANGTGLNDGQTVLTSEIIDQLLKCEPDLKLEVVDTYDYRKRIVPCMVSTVRNLIKCKIFILILSSNGRNFYFPIMHAAEKYFGKTVINRVVGGAYDKYLIEHPKAIKYAKKFDVNMVEGSGHAKRVRQLGLDNVEEVINFKNLRAVNPDDFPVYEGEPYKFCTFSRVTKEKGITSAIKAVQEVNNKGYDVRLDIYGPIEEEYREELEKLLENNTYVKYKGSVDPEESVDVLKNYYMLLFPTTWKGEGFPGTLIDAFFAGLPVIASDWNCNNELIEDYRNGFLYNWENPNQLVDEIIFSIENSDIVYEMRKNCIECAKQYTPEEGIKPILKYIYQ